MNITGSLIEAYVFCPRQAWLMARQIEGNQYNEFLEIGRIISNESYKRNKKEIPIKGGKIDFIKNENENYLVVEIKKSEKFLKGARMQLLYYLMKLREKGFNATGEIRVPKSKKIIKVLLNNKDEKKLKNMVINLEKILLSENIPEITNKSRCRNCSYFEFCWS